ncbi:hypothetical protein WJX81_005791 [Elliptochloris bilobata]|uniref:RanBD1 domain-containing protein n=1 Tax=Elliptochloris bilobata TaxID=381761 RepID=A0AAW1QXB1_9CHLO
MERKELFTSLLRTLNESFAAWVQQERADKVNELWIDGAEDYVKHAKKVLADFADVLGPAAEAPASAAAAANGSIFAVPLPAPAAASGPPFALPSAGLAAPEAPAPQAADAFALSLASGGLGLFGAPPASSAPAPFAGFSFAPGGGAAGGTSPSSAPAAGGLGLGFSGGFGASQPGAASAGALSNGGGAGFSGSGAFGLGAPPAGAFGGFGAPRPQPSLGVAAGGDGGAIGGSTEDATEEEAPKEFVPEVKVDEAGAAILYKSRAKVYVQGGDKAWKEKGQGLLTVRQPASGGTGPPQIVFTTESGRVLVNAALYKGIRVVPQATKPNMATLSLVVAATEAEEASMRPVLANLYSADAATDFVAAVAKAAPK